MIDSTDQTAERFPRRGGLSVPPGPPVLCVIVDAEEEFHWSDPISAQHHATQSIQAQKKAHEIFAHYGVVPTYLVTYPVATDPAAVRVLNELLSRGECDVGAQLHPWVTPPFSDESGERTSFPGNLDRALERAKLHTLVEAIQTSFRIRPTVYKAGRYGFGPHTCEILEEAGFEIDTSLIPRTDYSAVSGPDFSAFDYEPFWFGRQSRMLELPVTRALIGGLADSMPDLYTLAARRSLSRFRLSGLLARSRLIERVTLSPEGSDLAAMKRLTRALLARGNRILTLSYHSPSLAPGNTPYVRDAADLAEFLDRISGYLDFFCNELGGVSMTARALRTALLDRSAAADPGLLAGARPPDPPAKREPADCLVVANTFPPVHGGSAVVYDSLGRFSNGRVCILAPSQDYRTGFPILGRREFDRMAPAKIFRIRLLRTMLEAERLSIPRRLLAAASDVLIRLHVVYEMARILRTEPIRVICIGELIASGWLTWVCRYLFKRPAVIYVHGEEISTRSSYDKDGRRRRRILRNADGVVAVSRFTRDILTRDFGVPAEKVKLVLNGVDLSRFRALTRDAMLADRYQLAGRKVLLTISRLYERKGIDRVIEALPAILAQVPDLVYLIVGEGYYRPTLEALVARHGLADHVIFAGAVPDAELVAHYALGDVFVMANRELPDGETEGFGLVFLEANACGIPVVAGNAGGSVDAVENERNGLVVDGTDTGQIAAAVTRIFTDPALYARLRAQGHELAEQSTWARRVAEFLDYCDQVSDTFQNKR